MGKDRSALHLLKPHLSLAEERRQFDSQLPRTGDNVKCWLQENHTNPETKPELLQLSCFQLETELHRTESLQNTFLSLIFQKQSLETAEHNVKNIELSLIIRIHIEVVSYHEYFCIFQRSSSCYALGRFKKRVFVISSPATRGQKKKSNP